MSDIILGLKATKVEVETVPSTCVSMSLFDKILDPANGIVRENGAIYKCLEEYVDGVCVPDQVRQVSYSYALCVSLIKLDR